MSECNQCKKTLPANFVKCFGCESKYHFSSCCSLSESTYAGINAERKTAWRCHVCKPRKNSNNSYLVMFESKPQQKQQRREESDNEDTDNEDAKRFKDPININVVNNNLGEVKSDVMVLKTDVTSIKSDISDIKSTMQELATNISQSNMQMNNNIQTALANITSSLSTLASQVSELCEKNKEKEKQMQEMDNRIHKLEQQIVNKSIEIKNVTNQDISANEAVKKIGSSVNVTIDNNDISNAYRVKNSNKIIVEFCSLNKKKELLSNIKRHRIDANLINEQRNDDDNYDFIYINDLLTAHNRKLLWMAKTKAKETGWKFIWVRNGYIFAKKNETSNPIIINNTSDIEMITLTI